MRDFRGTRIAGTQIASTDKRLLDSRLRGMSGTTASSRTPLRFRAELVERLQHRAQFLAFLGILVDVFERIHQLGPVALSESPAEAVRAEREGR